MVTAKTTFMSHKVAGLTRYTTYQELIVVIETFFWGIHIANRDIVYSFVLFFCYVFFLIYFLFCSNRATVLLDACATCF